MFSETPSPGAVLLSPSDMVVLNGASKQYPMQQRPLQRMWQALTGGSPPSDAPVYTALHPSSLRIERGEVLGIVGKNGAGKSTLLQLISGTLQPSTGQIAVNGRISAILELGAGFNVEFTGRENIALAAATAGMPAQQVDALTEEIIDFSGIRPFIDQPIKTYSSGMQVRLAFSIATCTQPDLLIIDEALSVGDGEFARKSFDRILELKKGGATILFCSHSLFHIEALCSRAIWLDGGRIVRDAHPTQIIPLYQDFLDGAPLDRLLDNTHEPATDTVQQVRPTALQAHADVDKTEEQQPREIASSPLTQTVGHSRLKRLRVSVQSHDNISQAGVGERVTLRSGVDTLAIHAEYQSDMHLPSPSFAVTLHSMDGRVIGSAGAWNDGLVLTRDASGSGTVTVKFPQIGLLKGTYTVSAFLFCERGLHIYDNADHFASIEVHQEGIEQGLFHFPRRWLLSDQELDR